MLAEHEAAVGPITGMWKCACGEQSRARNDDGTLHQPDERRKDHRAHVAAAITAALGDMNGLPSQWLAKALATTPTGGDA